MKSRETQADIAAGDVTAPPAETMDTGSRGQLPIAVSEGDFATPTKRKRTITRPRGLKTLEETSSARTPEPPLAVETVIAGTPEPVPAIEPEVAPPRTPEAPARGPSVVDEFLAAPPTPEPEVLRTPTPEPLPPAASELDFTASSFPEPLDSPHDLAGEASVAPGNDYHEVVAHSDLPPDAGSPAVLAEEVAFEQPDADKAVVDNLLEQATAQLLASSDADVMAPDMIVFDDTAHGEPPAPGGAAVNASSASGPEPALSPLAQTLANMAEAMQGDLAEEGEIDIGDAPLLPLPVEALTPPRPRPPSPRTLPPPPPTDGGQSGDSSLASENPAPVPTGLPEALAERPRRPKRSKPWFEEVFDESYLRTLPFMTAEQTLREVDFIESSLGVGKGGEVLDVACGYGRHAIELVQRGLAVTGLDLSLPLLIRAADESQRRAVSVNFVHTDMREMAFDRQFAGAYCMLTSFGYFDEESNMRVAEGIARALKPGGRFLIDVVNRDYIVGDLPTRVWWEGDGCVVLEEVDFNFNTNRILTHRSVVFEDGHQLEQEISVRVYSLHELGKLLRQAGFRVLEVSGSIPTRGNFFGANSRNLLVLAERRAD